MSCTHCSISTFTRRKLGRRCLQTLPQRVWGRGSLEAKTEAAEDSRQSGLLSPQRGKALELQDSRPLSDEASPPVWATRTASLSEPVLREPVHALRQQVLQTYLKCVLCIMWVTFAWAVCFQCSLNGVLYPLIVLIYSPMGHTTPTEPLLLQN